METNDPHIIVIEFFFAHEDLSRVGEEECIESHLSVYIWWNDLSIIAYIPQKRGLLGMR